MTSDTADTGRSADLTNSREDVVVLHVDDDPQVCELVESYLERHDDHVTVVTETDPKDALTHLESNRVDCVVSDYQMPGLDGLELLALVRGRYPNLPFILFTGHGSEGIASKAINAGVTTYLTKDGREVYERLGNHIRNAVGHRRSERQAQIAQERILELYEQTDGFFTLDGDRTITYWNRKMADRTGRSAEEVVGERYLDAFPEAEGTELYGKYEETFGGSEMTEFDTYYEPHEYWIRVRAYPVDDGLFVHSRDISDEKERERELQTRNQVLESFANTVSHDLRNPLSIAEGRLELAQETGDFEHLETVAQAHNRMRNLIDELLRIARGEELEFEEVSVATVTEEAWSTVSAKGMELRVTDDAEFRAQFTQVRRLLENLFWNAFEHGEADEVRVGVTEDGRIFVEDDGVGIPPDKRDEVLEVGYSTRTGNPGYGLHIVSGIAELHDWELDVKTSDDGGARFEIREVEFVDE